MNISAENKPIGTWSVYSVFASPSQKTIETDRMVYYLSGGCLFSYDKDNDENYSYTTGNKMSDTDITDIYYNFDSNYLLVAYSSGNIDLVYDDGRVVNMSDISDSQAVPPLTINDVAFDGNKVYVATAFGLVEFDTDRHEVIQSGIYNTPVSAVTTMGNNIVIHAEGKMRFIAKNERFNTLDKFKEIYGYSPPKELHGVSDDKMLVRLNDGTYYLALQTINFETSSDAGWKPINSYHSTYSYLSYGKDGKIYYVADNNLYTLDENYDEVLVTVLPDELKDCKIGTYTGQTSIWSLNKDGIARHSVAGGDVTVLMQRFRPEELSVQKLCYFFPSADGRRLYAQNIGSTSYKFGNQGVEGYDVVQTASRIDLQTGDIEDVTAFPAPAVSQNAVNFQRNYGEYAMSPATITEDPEDSDTYYLCTNADGVYKITGGELVGRYNDSNSPLNLYDNRYITYGASIDRGGNLWIQTNTVTGCPSLIVLPSDKRRIDPKDVKESDWIIPDVGDYSGHMDTRFLHCLKSNMIFILDAVPKNMVLAYDTRGTFNDFSDDRYYLWHSFTDQDGKKFNPTHQASICEDLDGKVWIGTNEGIAEISSPSNAINPSMTINHIKVPRNDGTNAADYLVGSDVTFDISVDASNRKWLATEGSGLFLVSSDGHEIIENYTMDNSPLRSNLVNAVYADRMSSMVYIGTNNGLLSYSTDASPAMDDYSDIYAYPNPVRPDYTGPIYVRGLMENTLVKIADSSGNVIYQGRAEGGLFSWNGCNSSGTRVKTGVYYVFVSQNASGSASGAVTKIMVVN